MAPDLTSSASAVLDDDNDVVEQQRSEVSETISEFLPSWLTSFVVHLALVLLLALWVVKHGGISGGGIALSFQSGDGGLAGANGNGELEHAIEMPSELTAPAEMEAWADALAELPTEVADIGMELPEIKLSDVAVATPRSTGGGDAGLAGDGGDGNGYGGGDDGGLGINVGPIRTQVFGLSAEGMRFVYVFDRSESMNSVLTFTSEGEAVFSVTPLMAAKRELLKSLKDLENGHEFGIVFYNHSPWVFTLGRRNNSVLAATPGNKRRAQQFVESMYGHGKTNHMSPLEIALKMKPDVIFLLTDGERKDDLTGDELKKLKRMNETQHTQINVIQFTYKDQEGGSLVELANENGGKHLFFNISRLGPDGPDDMSAPGDKDGAVAASGDGALP